MTITKSTSQIKYLLDLYYKYLPKYTFPYIPFIIAAFFQSLAWMAGPIFLNNYELKRRILILILFAIGEYIFMSPAMNAGVELLGMKEPHLVIQYHITTLFVFILVNVFLFKKGFENKYILSFLFGGLAVYFANRETL
jgi:uncharacterized protein (DUF486 family)